MKNIKRVYREGNEGGKLLPEKPQDGSEGQGKDKKVSQDQKKDSEPKKRAQRFG